mmetsp:Transcript_41971/g.66529  ORF Transcript_41971/g.66529 Transcript_41971/m.66529 type:complete len:215 (+) Transcript_41971:495-1139(+)
MDAHIHTSLGQKVEAFLWHSGLESFNEVKVGIRIHYFEVSHIAITLPCQVQHLSARVEEGVQRACTLIHIQGRQIASLRAIRRHLADVPHADLPIRLGGHPSGDQRVALIAGGRIAHPLHLGRFGPLADLGGHRNLGLPRVHDVQFLILGGNGYQGAAIVPLHVHHLIWDRDAIGRFLFRQVPNFAGHVKGRGGQNVFSTGIEGAERNLLAMAF